jgi:hypothetical protein
MVWAKLTHSYRASLLTRNLSSSPGRFLGVNLLKLIVVYLLSKYDIELLDRRPKDQWIGAVIVPPRSATLTFKRAA